MSDLKYLPKVDWTKRTESGGVVERPTIAAVATPAADRQMTIAAAHAPIRTVYGEDRVGAQIANVAVYNGAWVIQCVWCEGEIDSINDVRLNDEALPGDASATHYTGTAGQTADPTLAAAITGYADALPGIAYSVLTIPAASLDGFPQIAATIKGRKLYDPRTTLTAWSDNPALALRDFIVRATGRSMDETSVGTVADACDALVSGAKRRTIGLTLDSVQEVQRWLDTLRAYASCWCALDGDVVKLIADRPRSTDATLTHAAGQIKSLTLKKRGMRAVPTVLRVRYTNTSTIPWRDDYVEADSGATPRRESEVPLPGIHSAAQANREAIERLNKLRLCDLSAEMEVFDEALKFEVGDVVAVTHPAGLTAKAMRVLGVSGEMGRYRLSLVEYDPAVYSDAVTVTPTYADTALPNPLAPPAPTGLTVSEEVFQLEDGTWSSRLVASWAAASFPYLTSYRLEVLATADPIYATTTALTTGRSPAVKEGIVYTVRVATISSVGAQSAWASQSVTAQGKLLLPSDVPSLTGFEVGGEVRLTIGAATDLDMVGYEVRYGAVGVTWANAKFCDFVNAASGVGGYCIYKDAPAGTWDFLACARDSIGQYSATAARMTITVTLNAFLIGNHDYTNPTLTGMVEYALPGDANRYFVTEDGVTAATKFPSTASTYVNVAATYHASQTSQITSEAWDVGVAVAGNWNGTISSAVLNGSKTDSILLSSNGSSYTDQGALTAKANGRFGKVQSVALTTSTLKATLPTMRLRLDAIPRVENGTVTTNASGATTITLSNKYTAAKAITVTPQGTASRQAVVDNIVLSPTGTNTFDIYLFNSSGTQIAGAVLWAFEGV